MMNTPKNFEELREYFWQERADAVDCMLDKMTDEPLTEYQMGTYKGEIAAYDSMLQVLRNIIKYGENE